MELLLDLYKVFSPSGKEKKMRKFIKDYIRRNIDATYWSDEKGNIYVVKGESESYPCVVAHIDQVQDTHSKDFQASYCEESGIIVGFSKKNHRQEGLGADDKNGIWVALKCLEKYDTIKCAFFVGEEIGCVGSNAADMTFFADCRFVLQCDRRNGGDLITDVWGQMASDEFINATNYAAFGYKPTHGMMTDVATLRENGLKVSALNISCGYYEPHTDQEFTDWDELQNCLAFVENIIENCTDTYEYEFVWSTKNTGYKYSGWSLYDDYYQSGWTLNDENQYNKQYDDLVELLYEAVGEPDFDIYHFYYEWADMFNHLSFEDFLNAYEGIMYDAEYSTNVEPNKQIELWENL